MISRIEEKEFKQIEKEYEKIILPSHRGRVHTHFQTYRIIRKESKYNKIKNTLKKEFGRFVKYGTVGAIGSLINYIILFVLTDFVGIKYWISAFIAISAACTFNYFANHYWSFKDYQKSNKNLLKGWIKYYIVSWIASFIYMILLIFFTSSLGIYYIISAVLATIISTIPNYLVVRKIVWATR